MMGFVVVKISSSGSHSPQDALNQGMLIGLFLQTPQCPAAALKNAPCKLVTATNVYRLARQGS